MSFIILESVSRCRSLQQTVLGLGDMLDEVIKHFPEDADTEEDDDIPRIASCR